MKSWLSVLIFRYTIHFFKVREQAIATCGYLCVGQQEFPHMKKVLEAFLALAKEVSLNYCTISYVLVCCY